MIDALFRSFLFLMLFQFTLQKLSAESIIEHHFYDDRKQETTTITAEIGDFDKLFFEYGTAQSGIESREFTKLDNRWKLNFAPPRLLALTYRFLLHKEDGSWQRTMWESHEFVRENGNQVDKQGAGPSVSSRTEKLRAQIGQLKAQIAAVARLDTNQLIDKRRQDELKVRQMLRQKKALLSNREVDSNLAKKQIFDGNFVGGLGERVKKNRLFLAEEAKEIWK